MAAPPSIRYQEPAAASYLTAAAMSFPACFVWVFTNIFLLPRLEMLWLETNLSGSKAQWLLDSSRFLTNHMALIFGAAFLCILAMEFFLPAWPRYRRICILTATVAFHTIVLLGLAAISTAVLLAAPLLTRAE